MADAPKRISVERVIDAPPERIFDVLADPAQHADIDGSGTVHEPRAGSPERLSKDAKFGMSMRMGVPYRTANTVVEFEENRRIGWWHMAHNLWLYELEPQGAATLVRESFDWSRSRRAVDPEADGVPVPQPGGDGEDAGASRPPHHRIDRPR